MFKKVLVTGADGFIGSHLTERLVRQGYAVRAMTFYNAFDSRGWLDDIDGELRGSVEIVAGDVRDSYFVRTAAQGCQAVVHLAALIAIPFSYRSPESYLQTNILGTLNVVQAARDLGIEKVVHTSTSEVYGTAQRVPIDEDHPQVGQSVYAATKIGADQIALSFHRSFGTPVAVVRPFNTYGPRQSTRAVIPAIITQIAGGNGSIELGALHPTRDFSFVEDTASGIQALLEDAASVGEVINIGSGFEISIGDTAAMIGKLMGKAVETRTATERMRPPTSEVERLLADTSKARRLLGWSPEHGGLDGFKRGLESTIGWFVKPANLAKYRDIGSFTL